MSKYHNDDITFCCKSRCGFKLICDRHIDNYKGYKPYCSVADLENTIYCIKPEIVEKKQKR